MTRRLEAHASACVPGGVDERSPLSVRYSTWGDHQAVRVRFIRVNISTMTISALQTVVYLVRTVRFATSMQGGLLSVSQQRQQAAAQDDRDGRRRRWSREHFNGVRANRRPCLRDRARTAGRGITNCPSRWSQQPDYSGMGSISFCANMTKGTTCSAAGRYRVRRTASCMQLWSTWLCAPQRASR